MTQTLRDSLRGFPVWQMTVISLIRFSEPLAFTSLFPFIYFLIKSFDIAEDEKSISKYSGYLTASFAFTQFICCIHWGQLSDKVGRKIVLMIGLAGTGISMLIFAFSTNFWMALFARSLAGALNGNISTLRVMIGEIATERQHQAIAFSTLPLLWNVGGVIGPLIGGYFTRTEGSTENLVLSAVSFVDKFMDKFPYALSSIVVSGFTLFSMVIGLLFLEETHYKAKFKRDVGLEIGDFIRRKLGYHVPLRPWQQGITYQSNKRRMLKNANNTSSNMTLTQDAAPAGNETESLSSDVEYDENSPLTSGEQNQITPIYSSVGDTEEAIDDDDDDDTTSIESNNIMSRRMSSALIRRYSSTYSIKPTMSRASIASTVNEDQMGVFRAFTNRNIFTPVVIQTILGNFILGFHVLIYQEFLPIYLAGDYLPQELKFPFRITGGFGWNSHEIGTLLSTTGFFGVLVVLFVFPVLDRYTSTINGYRLSSCIFPIVYLNIAFVIFTTKGYNDQFPAKLSTYLLYINGAFGCLASGTAFPQIMMLIHRAAPVKYRSFINSSTLSATSFSRFISPILFGKLMSFFDKLKLGGCSWIFITLVAVLGLISAFTMEEHDEDLKALQQAVGDDEGEPQNESQRAVSSRV